MEAFYRQKGVRMSRLCYTESRLVITGLLCFREIAGVTIRQMTSLMFIRWFPIVVVQSLSCVLLFMIPWTATCQASLSFIVSRNLLKLMSIESVMLSNHLILCHLWSPCSRAKSPPTARDIFKSVNLTMLFPKTLQWLLHSKYIKCKFFPMAWHSFDAHSNICWKNNGEKNFFCLFQTYVF